MICVEELSKCKRIIGAPLTLEEMLNLVEEREIGYSPYWFKNGDEDIISQVQSEMELKNRKVMEAEPNQCRGG
jgi:hypothetical protein